VRGSRRFVRLRLGALIVGLAVILVAPVLWPPQADAATVANAAGRYDTLVLRNMGGKRAALVQLVAENGAFTQRELWRSKKGAFDTRKATFAAGDVNADGIADGIVLYELGGGRSRLLIYRSDGFTAKQVVAWTSKRGAFKRAKAKLAVTDLDRDGRDDLLVLYDRGRAGVALYSFISTGVKFKQKLAFSQRSGLIWSKAQLAAGDVTGDGRGDGLILYAATAKKARLLVFSAKGSKLTKKVFWSGAYAAGHARLAAGDVDSDGDCDAVCLMKQPNGKVRLDVFASSGKAFKKPVAWYKPGATPVPAVSRFCVGDVTGDGRADVLTAAAAGTRTRVTTWVSSGSGFVPKLWFTGAWRYATVSLGVAPSVGITVSDKAEPLTDASRRYLRRVGADGTLTFAGKTGQVARLETGDVLLAPAGPTFPSGLCRKVLSVGTQDGEVVVKTAQADLCDVIDQGQVALHMNITPEDLADDGIRARGVRIVRDRPSPPGVRSNARRKDDPHGITFTLTAPIGDWAEIEGEITLDPDAYVNWQIGWGGLQSASYRQVLTTSTDISVSVKKTVSGTKEITLYKRTLTPITIMVGAVPVVILPEFEVKVGIDGEVVAGVTAGTDLSTETWAQISWDGNWHLGCGSSYEATPKRPQVFGQVTVTGFASAGLDFEVYGVAGPTVALKPYVELAADTQADPWWTLSAGVRGEIGFEVEVLDHEIFSKTFPLDVFGPWIIAQAGSDGSDDGSSEYQAPSVSGKILDATSGARVKSAWVEVSRSGAAPRRTSSAADGTYVFSGLSPGSYTVTAGKNGYADNQRTVVVVEGTQTTGQDIALTREQYQGITGHVFAEAGHYPIFEASVELYDADDTSIWSRPLQSYVTYADGSYEFTGLEPGNYRIKASAGYCYPESVTVSLSGGQLRENVDLYLVAFRAQGVFGRVVDSLTGDPIEGACVMADDGGETGGYVEDEVFTAADGSFVLDGYERHGMAVGTHGLSVSKGGYEELRRTVTVTRGRITDVGTIHLKELGGYSMQSERGACIRWSEGVPTSTGRGGYEFWFRPFSLSGTEWGNEIAQVTYDYPDWRGGGPRRFPAMSIAADEVLVGGSYATLFSFTLAENRAGGDPDAPGTYHTIRGTTPIVSGKWYHIAAQYGPSGMQLYVNGHLEASNAYPGAPEPFGGASGGWFSLGENYLEGQGRPHTAGGDYRGLVVREWPHYDADFTPYDDDPAGGDALVYDLLAGMTNGENLGFVPTP